MYLYREGKERNMDSDNTIDKSYECIQNPIDPLFLEALENAHTMVAYRACQELYYDIWKSQYEDIMKKIYKKCKYEEDIANYNLFVKEMEEGFDKLVPLILNEMLDNYDRSESSEKYNYGNGTNTTLLMYRGTMYRNVCMFFIPLLEENEYQFPKDVVQESISEILKEE